ncbi:DNA-binding GntR family transcriptional regulator [Clostridiales Family XIII bacterium PM5-7]
MRMNKFKTLKDHVYDYIASQIAIGNLRPNERINENTICQELDISRTPVREALIQLASEGILETQPRKGFVLKSLSEKDAAELYTIIGTLDGLCVQLAAPNLGDKDIKEMQFYVDSMYLAIESRNYEIYMKQQKLFHQIYIDQCGNDMLIHYLDNLKNKFIKQGYTDEEAEGEIYTVLKNTNDEHAVICQLLIDHKIAEVAEYIAKVHWAPEKAQFDLLSAPEKN